MDPIDRIWLNLMVMFLGGIIIIGMEKAFFSPAMIQQSIVLLQRRPGNENGHLRIRQPLASVRLPRRNNRGGPRRNGIGARSEIDPFIKLF
jgi:hypothetical protein